MKLDGKSFISLKTSVIIAVILIWNVGFLYGMHLGGGGLRGGLSPIGMEITGYICLALCIFSLSVAVSNSVQSWTVAPSRAANFNPREFYFLAFVSGMLAISRFVFPAAQVGASAL